MDYKGADYMFLKRNFSILALVAFFLWITIQSCNHKEGQMKEYIIRLQETPVCVPLDKLVSLNENSEVTKDVADGCDKLKLVVYSDSIICSSCRIKEMYRWDDFLSRLGQCNSRIEVLFIFAPSHDKIGQFKMAIKTLPKNYPIYMDTTNIFLTSNPQIPSNPIFHTFLLDEWNNVLLVGNPLENEKVATLFWRTVEERLGKPKDDKSE